MKVVVSQRSKQCVICALPIEALASVNAVIWPEPGVSLRSRNYRADAVRATAAQGTAVEAKTITRHAAHIEASWHKVDARAPAAPGEVPVFPTDYQSMVAQAASVGAVAMDRLKDKLPEMDARDLLSTAKMGMGAVTGREALRLKAQEVDTASGLLAAMFGLAGGHLDEDDVPEAEVIDVTPQEDLLDVVRKERETLKRLQAGEAVGAG